MPKLLYKCIMMIGDPVRDKSLLDPANDHINPCHAPAANCHFCKRPFCPDHYVIHSRTCKPPAEDDDLAEENDARFRAEDERQQAEREDYLRDDSL